MPNQYSSSLLIRGSAKSSEEENTTENWLKSSIHEYGKIACILDKHTRFCEMKQICNIRVISNIEGLHFFDQITKNQSEKQTRGCLSD